MTGGFPSLARTPGLLALRKMKLDLKSPWLFLGVVLGWRLLLLVLTAQPVPGSDAFLFDGAPINWLLHGQYYNPSLAECFPISGRQVFAAYPPIYQGLLLPWMALFGTSARSAMWFHFVCACVGGAVLVKTLQLAYPKAKWVNFALLFLFAVTFDDRPEGLAHVFGLLALLATAARMQGRIGWLPGQAGIAAALFCSLYTSIIVGAFYCGVTLLAGVVAWFRERHPLPWPAAAGVVVLFAGVTFWIAKAHPLWWSGFLENARQTPVSTAGLRFPQPADVLKVVRNAPVFVAALVWLPWLWMRLRGNAKRVREPTAQSTADLAWVSLTTAITAGGLLLMLGGLTLFTANYVVYLWYAQVLLAAGLITLAADLGPRRRQALKAALGCGLVLVSIRAAGMTTWGALCAADVNYQRAQTIVRRELEPFVKVEAPVSVSSAFLYEAASLGVARAVHSDWGYDRRGQAAGSELSLLKKLRPAKLVLTQFDYYRVHAPIIEELGRHPELGSSRVRNTASLPAPDSFPSLQRILQQVSWAPVIVDFTWK